MLAVPYRPSLLRHWPLILATVLLSSAFAVAFLVSIERATAARSAELSLDTSRAHTVPEQGLTLTRRLGTLPPDTPLPRKPTHPAPWWPVLLFSLAFFCGWLFRNTVRRSNAVAADSIPDADEHKSLQTPIGRHEYAYSPGEEKPERKKQTPDLAVDFPWDEAALKNDASLSSEEHIARLEMQNASKAEIIKALERLVAENREKWLHQDETEARLDKHIRDLSDDLRVAIRQLQQLQFDSSLPVSKALENSV